MERFPGLPELLTSKRRKAIRKDNTRLNEAIKEEEVRLILADGEHLGLVKIEEAMSIADQEGLDLVEIVPDADPPVCKIMDYGKFKYQRSKKQHDAKKHQKIIHVKEIKFRPATDAHDLDFKLKHARLFLKDGNKVKITLTLRGREMMHKDRCFKIFDKIVEGMEDCAIVEQNVKSEGRNMTLVLGPIPIKLNKH